MYFDFGKLFRIFLLLAVGAAIGIAGLSAYQHFKGPKQTVSVIGIGEVDAVTDQATITVQINNKKDAQILKKALLELGIPESRITESSYYSGPIIQAEASSAQAMIYPRPNPSPTSTTNFTIVLDSLKNIEKVLSVINANPNTQITNTYYSVNNMKNWQSRARDEAIKDARSQAESAAMINHLSVGRLISLTDVNSTPPIVEPMMLKGTQSADSGPAGQTQSGNVYYSEQTVKVTASYNATYELY